MKRLIFITERQLNNEDLSVFKENMADLNIIVEQIGYGSYFTPGYEDLICTDSKTEYERFKGIGEEAVVWIEDINDADSFGGAKYIVLDALKIEADYYDKVYKRLRGIPWVLAETERLILRETTLEDVDAFVEIYKDPEMTRYNEPLYTDLEKEREYIKEYIDKVYAVQGFGIWTVVRKEDNKVIGRAGLVVREGYDDVEVGFAIGVAYQHKGYGREAVSECLKIAKKLEFKAVNALIMPQNQASIKLVTGLGFKHIDQDLYSVDLSFVT